MTERLGSPLSMVEAGLLRDWLPPPADVVVPIAELPYHWRVTEVVAQCRRPRLFDAGYTLAGRIRGALGAALCDAGAHRPRSLRALPPAYRILFAEPAVAPASAGPLFHNPTRPYILFTTEEHDQFTVVFRLFGYAAAWLAECRGALLAGLARGLSIASGARVRTPVEVLSVETRQLSRPAVPEDSLEALLVFQSPACFARDKAQAVEREAVLGSLFSRTSGLAAWHGIALDADFGALAGAANGLRFDGSRLRPMAWDRLALRQGGRRVPMTGVLGAATLTGNLAPFAALLALAPTCHLGSHTVFGMGQCSVSLLS